MGVAALDTAQGSGRTGDRNMGVAALDTAQSTLSAQSLDVAFSSSIPGMLRNLVSDTDGSISVSH